MAGDAASVGWADWQLLTVGWLLTYLLHSTLLLGGVWLVTSRFELRCDALKETLWKVALVGGLVSATVQLATGLRPLGGYVTLTTTHTGPAAVAVADAQIAEPLEQAGRSTLAADSVAGAEHRSAGPSSPIPSLASNLRPGAGVIPSGDAHESDTALMTAAPAVASPSSSRPQPASWLAWSYRLWPGILMWPALGACAIGLLAAAAAPFRLRARLAGRSVIRDGPVRRTLDRLCRRAGWGRTVRLTCSNRIPVPIALGIRRLEICLPARALTDMSLTQVECILAHELAHLLRRDPAWLAAYHLFEAVLFFQPLNRVARRRLEQLAEYACDRWAVEATGGNLTLAGCLAEIAGWLMQSPKPRLAAAAAPMARSRSALGRRLARLLDARQPPMSSSSIRPGRLMLIAATVLMCATLIVPGVSARSSDSHPPPGESHSPQNIPSGPQSRTIVSAAAGSRRPVAESLAALQDELKLLDEQLRLLKAAAEGSPLQTELAQPIERLERRADRLRGRWEAVHRLVRRGRDQQPPGPALRPSSDSREPHNNTAGGHHD